MSGISTPPIPGLKPSASTGGLSIVTENGTIDLGAANPWRAHLKTDQQAFHLEKALEIVGNVAFHEGNVPLLRGALYERLHVRCEFAPNVHGGATSSGSWQTRPLNTIRENFSVGNPQGIVAANVVTVPAGKYRVWARVPTNSGGYWRARLVDADNNTSLLDGSSCAAGGGSTTDSVICGTLDLAASTNLRLEARVQSGNGAGMGYSTGFGGPEIYAEIIFERV